MTVHLSALSKAFSMHDENYWTRAAGRAVTRRRLLASAGAAAGLALAGCGDDSSGAASTPKPPSAAAGSSVTVGSSASATKPADFLAGLSDNPPDPIQEKDYK